MIKLMMGSVILVGKIETCEGKSNANNANGYTDDGICPWGRNRWIDLIKYVGELYSRGICLNCGEGVE